MAERIVFYIGSAGNSNPSAPAIALSNGTTSYTGSRTGTTDAWFAVFDVEAKNIPSGIYSVVVDSVGISNLSNIFIPTNDIVTNKMGIDSAIELGNEFVGSSIDWEHGNPTLVINPAKGIKITTDGLVLDQSSTGGLGLNGSDEAIIKLQPNKGLETNISGLGVKLADNSLALSSSGLKVNINDSSTVSATSLWSSEYLANVLSNLAYEIPTTNMVTQVVLTNFYLRILLPIFDFGGNAVNGFYHIEYGWFTINEYTTSEPSTAEWQTLKDDDRIFTLMSLANFFSIEKPPAGDDIYNGGATAKIIYRVNFKNFVGETGWSELSTGQVFDNPELAMLQMNLNAVAGYLASNPLALAVIAQNMPAST